MLDVERLKVTLVAEGKVEAARLEETEHWADQQSVSLTEALASRLVLGFADLGAGCSAVTGLPYVPLVPTPPSDTALRLISPQCAAAWETVPVRYEPRENVLQLAIHDPDQRARLQRIFHFFMQPHQLEFSIAPDVEIARACRRYYGVFGKEDRAARPSPRRSGDPVPSELKLTRKRTPAQKQTAGRRAQPRQPAATPEPSYEVMCRSLVNAATMIVRMQLADEPDAIHETRTAVHYCQLMAARLRLSRVQTDALVLAAWLSPLRSRMRLTDQLTTPYGLAEIIPPENKGASASSRIEARILSLVSRYHEVRNDDAGPGRDVNQVRRALQLRWSSAPEDQDMLEAFLQILVDEEFLDKLSGSDGRILVVDPQEESTCTLVPALVRIGYTAMAVAGTEEARAVLEAYSPDLVIVDMTHDPLAGIGLCEALRGNEETTALPILSLVDENDGGMAARSLRAGADDYVTRPVNMELLLLKVQARVEGEARDIDADGVSGSLEGMGFTDMIQILSAGHKNVEIVLSNNGDEGRVYIQNGEVVHAVLGEEKGERAFFALMRWKQGRFAAQACAEFPERTIQTSTMSLLMEGARQVDESTAAV